ncbi:glycosyltransferase [Microbacterium sp. B2969]|uniref:Glycosyltransferase n=1 Tax=Microbacterium alkaliflavum TaxID=3248839 RepID=A0ABW7Q9M2_9MICO
MKSGRTAVSLVCVSNDADVLATCLQRSVSRGLAEAPATELIVVDNRNGEFGTAGGALNHGARQARNDVVVFVHQDVYLHSLADLERAAHLLSSASTIGVLGANGIDARGVSTGRIRDRILALGSSAAEPRDVDSMDEVLFMVERRRLSEEPLADDPLLGWHAYAVEYSARMRSMGLRAVVVDIPLTHNSMTTNLAGLDVAHSRVGDQYPALLPIRTTCGTIVAKSPGRWGALARRRAHTARVWLRESRAAARVSRSATRSPIVLGDIRFSLDDAAQRAGATAIRAFDIDSGEPATSVEALSRRGLPFSAATVSASQADAAIADADERTLVVITNVAASDLSDLSHLGSRRHVVGLSQEAGLWVVVGASYDDARELWPGRRHRPFGGLFDRRNLEVDDGVRV